MTLTPSDIEQKTFSTALRGYNLDEVDDFLDEIVRSMRKLHEDLDAARAELDKKPLEVPVPAPTPPPAPVEEPLPVVEAPPPAPIDESAVGKALIAAQETAERIVTDARSEADQILVNAKSEADSYEETRLKRKAEAEQEIGRIGGLVERVKSELADLSVVVGVNLDEMSSSVESATSELDTDEPGASSSDEDDESEPTDDVDDDEDTEDAEDEDADDVEDGDDDEEDDEEDEEEESEENGDAEEYFNFPDHDDDDPDDRGTQNPT